MTGSPTAAPTGPATHAPDSAIRLESVVKTYGRGEVAVHALGGIDLEIRTGQFLVVLSPGGSGKTTLLNLERATEPAALRTFGMTRATIARLVTAENVLLTFAGLVPGLAGGYAMAAVFMASFSSDLVSFDLHVRPTTFLLTGLVIMAVAIFSQWPALRAVGRLDLGRIVRERSA